MLVIRLARTGRRNQPKFRVAVAEHSKPVKGKVVEIVGHYNPTVKKDPLTINKEAIESWLGKGVQPSNTVSRLLNKHAGFNLDVKQRPPRQPKAELKPDTSDAGKTDEKKEDEGKSAPTDKPEVQPAVASEEAKEGEPKQEEAPVEKSTSEIKSEEPKIKELKAEETPAEEPKTE